MYKKEVYYDGDYACIKDLREEIKQISLEYKFFDLFKNNIEICVGELFTNIIKHGQKSEVQDKKIKVILNLTSSYFEIIFEYFGDIPSEEKIKQVSKIQEIFDVIELSESGRGIFIMNKLMDEVKFEKKEDFCRASMKKNLENF